MRLPYLAEVWQLLHGQHIIRHHSNVGLRRVQQSHLGRVQQSHLGLGAQLSPLNDEITQGAGPPEPNVDFTVSSRDPLSGFGGDEATQLLDLPGHLCRQTPQSNPEGHLT